VRITSKLGAGRCSRWTPRGIGRKVAQGDSPGRVRSSTTGSTAPAEQLLAAEGFQAASTARRSAGSGEADQRLMDQGSCSSAWPHPLEASAQPETALRGPGRRAFEKLAIRTRRPVRPVRRAWLNHTTKTARKAAGEPAAILPGRGAVDLLRGGVAGPVGALGQGAATDAACWVRGESGWPSSKHPLGTRKRCSRCRARTGNKAAGTIPSATAYYCLACVMECLQRWVDPRD